MPPLPDWSRAWGSPILAATIRAVPEDFIVDELLSIEFSGDGEHDWLRIEKSGANTLWVAERIASHARTPLRDVGYSGLKDRHARTTQWFSVRRRKGGRTDWAGLEIDGVRLLEHRIHSRKLKRGAHRGNAFRITVRSLDVGAMRDELTERLAIVAENGVPNYFGEQRFGRDGGNVDLGRAVLEGRRLSRAKRSIGISALRSFRFNEALDGRVTAGNWNRLLAGDVVALDGTNSVFEVDEPTPELEMRCAEFDIHPAGELAAMPAIAVDRSFRPLRMCARKLDWEIEPDLLRLEFELARGCYATALLRELVRWPPATGR